MKLLSTVTLGLAGCLLTSCVLPPTGGTNATDSAITSICDQRVSGVSVQFSAVTAPPNKTGFKGNVWRIVNNKEVLVPRSDYYLQWFRSATNKGCCTPVPGSTTEEVQCPVIAGKRYSFKAFFITAPTGSPRKFKLKEGWTP